MVMPTRDKVPLFDNVYSDSVNECLYGRMNIPTARFISLPDLLEKILPPACAEIYSSQKSVLMMLAKSPVDFCVAVNHFHS